jgi:hypothetical protein
MMTVSGIGDDQGLDNILRAERFWFLASSLT